MKSFNWNEEKAWVLKNDKTRGNIGFDDCMEAIRKGKILEILPNPSLNFPLQMMFVLDINDYAYCVPFIESEHEVFLKTVFPSRKYTAYYLKGKQ